MNPDSYRVEIWRGRNDNQKLKEKKKNNGNMLQRDIFHTITGRGYHVPFRVLFGDTETGVFPTPK